MTRGSYQLLGQVERFTCGPDGAGWAYAAVRTDAGTGAVLGRLELRVDAAGATTRLHVEAGGWVLRGGCVGSTVLWRRGDDEREAVADGFTGTSPGYACASARRLGLAVGQSHRLRLLEITEPVLATRLVDQSWTRTAQDRYLADDLATGQRRELRLDDDGVVSGTGLAVARG